MFWRAATHCPCHGPYWRGFRRSQPRRLFTAGESSVATHQIPQIASSRHTIGLERTWRVDSSRRFSLGRIHRSLRCKLSVLRSCTARLLPRRQVGIQMAYHRPGKRLHHALSYRMLCKAGLTYFERPDTSQLTVVSGEDTDICYGLGLSVQNRRFPHSCDADLILVSDYPGE